MFQFKQFAISDQNTAMKIGTDGILLGSWVNVGNATEILDIGTGTGVIAIMCAQKNHLAEITALEIDENAVVDAQINIQNCPWNNRIHLIHQSLQEFEKNNLLYFDSIVSNPPYFENSQKAANDARIKARHTDSLHYIDLLRFAQNWLTDEGSLNIILPLEQGYQCVEASEAFNLKPIRICEVHPIPTKPAHRLLISFGRATSNTKAEKSKLVIETGIVRHEYTEAYQKVCKDFYLKF
jgi:tRNA1Val (adenine37-N6)-methyltransferase